MVRQFCDPLYLAAVHHFVISWEEKRGDEQPSRSQQLDLGANTGLVPLIATGLPAVLDNNRQLNIVFVRLSEMRQTNSGHNIRGNDREYILSSLSRNTTII